MYFKTILISAVYIFNFLSKNATESKKTKALRDPGFNLNITTWLYKSVPRNIFTEPLL